MSDLMPPMIPQVRPVRIRDWFHQALVSARGWRKAFLFLLASQIVLAGLMGVSENLIGDPATLVWVTYLYLALQVLVHGVALSSIIRPHSRLAEMLGLSGRRALSQLAVALILGVIVFVGSFILALPFLYGFAFTPMDPAANRMVNQVLIVAFSLVSILTLSRLMTAQAQVMRGSGPLRAIGDAWRTSRGAWGPGLIGATTVVGLFALTIFLSASVGLQLYFAVIGIVGFCITLTVAAVIEESYHQVTTGSVRALASINDDAD